MTGEMLFFRYAFPCVDSAGGCSVSEKHKQEFNSCKLRNQTPNRRRLKFCFRAAFLNLRKLAVSTGHEVWSLANVQNFWRHHHGHEGDCAVHLIEVQHTEDNVIFTEQGRYLNLYDLKLKPGDRVYTHKRCAIEKA